MKICPAYASITTLNWPIKKYLDTLHYTYYDLQFGVQVISKPRINPLWLQEQQRKKREQQLKQLKRLLQVETADNGTQNKANKTRSAFFENLANEYQRTNEPLKDRINPIWIDTLLRFELSNEGINQPINYEVTTAHND